MSWPRQGSQNPLDNRECKWKTWISWVWGFEVVHAVKGSFEVAPPPNASVQAIQRESHGLALGDLKDRLRPQDAIETTPGGDEYVVPAMYLFLMESLSVDYPSYLALSTQMTKLSTTPSSCRPVCRKWGTPSTSPH